MTGNDRRSRRTARALLCACAVAIIATGAAPALLAQCLTTTVTSGTGTIVAPGANRQAYRPFPVDLTGYERGVLIIEVTLDSGESAASFDLYPALATLPTTGDPVGVVMPGTYDVRPGRSIVMSYTFTRPGRYVFAATGNWGSRQGSTNTFSFSARVENGTPSLTGAAPRVAPLTPPPLPSTAGARYCCSLGQVALSGGGALDPARLAGHRYGTTGFAGVGEPMGYIYTTNVGLLDIGHVRDFVDRTRAIHAYLSGTGPVAFSLAGNRILIPIVPGDPDGRLDLASAIAYVDGLVHELETWGMSSQDFSSFSPEDLVSNLVGIELGRRVVAAGAYQNDQEFNACVDATMSGLMRELNAQPAIRTSAALRGIEGEGNWYLEYKVGLVDPGGIERASVYTLFEALRRRNFTATPWFARLPRDPLPAVPRWLTADRFAAHYGRFVYVMKSPVKGASVRAGSVPAAAASLRIQKPAPRFLSCETVNDFPAEAIQLFDAAGASVPGQVACVEDETGRQTLTTVQAAIDTVRTAWLAEHRGAAECGFARAPVSVTAELLQVVGLIDAAPSCR